MTEDKSLDILKQAILLEKRGKSFYQSSAEQAENQAVKDFFEAMADEETHHIKILSESATITHMVSESFSIFISSMVHSC